MEFWSLFVVALMPVLKVLLITGIGLLLATKRVDILGLEARKHLNILVYFVLNPALVGSNLAKFITLRSIVKMWFVPVSVLITFIVGSMLGWFLLKVTRPPKDLRGLILGCCAAGNLGNMPLIIIPAVCREKSSPFGDANVCTTSGLAYTSLSMAIGSICMWSYVYNIVRIYSTKDSDEATLDALPEGTEAAGEAPEIISACRTGPLLPLQDSSRSEGQMEQFEVGGAVSEGNEKVTFLENVKQRLENVIEKLHLRRLFLPSINGAIVGFIIGAIPPFRKALIGDDAPLRVVEDSAYLLGQSAVTIVTLIVGANLLKGFKGSNVPILVIIGIVAVRYIILPISGVAIIKYAVRFGLLNSDPLYQFAILIQFALPPAINIGTMTQLFGAGETACSVIMLWTYALSAVSLTLWSAFFMWFVKIKQS